MILPIWTVSATINGKPISQVCEAKDETPYETGHAFGLAFGYACAFLAFPSAVDVKITFSNPDQLDPDQRVNLITDMEMKDGETSLKTMPYVPVPALYTYNPLDYSLTVTVYESTDLKKLH